MSETPLEAVIAGMIRDDGPMAIDRYMALCLTHPEHGYYVKRDPLGAEGDFITSPEISQLFGELIGIWCAQAFQAIGAPDKINLIELGPGRGTLMSDILRAAKVMPEFARALCVHLVETSPVLRAVQQQVLGAQVTWHSGLTTLPEGASLIIANEFLDALPIRQFEFRDGHWMERRVGVGGDGRLKLGLVPSRQSFGSQPEGTVIETSLSRESLARAIGARLAAWPGAALIIDYGHLKSAPGDTLQAVRAHRPCSILDRPGQSDLTSHVDFEAISAAFADVGALVLEPMTQHRFLLAMGIEARAAALSRNASEGKREIIRRAVERLAGEAQMGNLFKVLAGVSPGIAAPYPFGNP
jgi:SAM-dependent MidA family methyltransferase